MTGVFAGSFDPPTLGHLDIIERASRICGRLIVLVSPNSLKTGSFDFETRKAWLEQMCAHLPNVSVDLADGLTVSRARELGADVLIRSIRNASDLEGEANNAWVNAKLPDGMETLVLFARPEFTYVSSSNVRELLRYHQDISHLVPACVWKDLKGDQRVSE